MNIREFQKLTAGTLVNWREGKLSPRRGEITETGVVVIQGYRHFVLWHDGQETEGNDDWALQNVELPPEAHA